MSFLEMLDVLNDQLISKGEEPVAFDHDCREGICGMCSLYINGEAHGPDRLVTTCQLHMRKFKDGDTIYIEPFRANAFPVVKDLVVDRSAFDRIQHAGGYVSVNTSGNTQDANAIPIEKQNADDAFDAATCIGCGACVATCKNSSAMLFVSAKVSQFALLPQGEVEAKDRVLNMGLWYRLAPVSFVGGSLTDRGGHNPYEPAALGSAIIHGPHVRNFRDIYERLNAFGGALCVKDAPELTKAVTDLIRPDHRAPMAYAAWEISSSGADVTDKALALILDHLPGIDRQDEA